MAEDNAVDPLGHSSTLLMQELDEPSRWRHVMHVDVSVAREHVQARLAAALAAVPWIVDESHAPGYWTLADQAAIASVSAPGQIPAPRHRRMLFGTASTSLSSARHDAFTLGKA